MELTWLGTAGFRIRVGQTTLLFDPYIRRSNRARPKLTLKLEDLDRADYIFLSHGHFDHAQDVPEIARRSGARVLASNSVCDQLGQRGVPPQQLRPLEGVKVLGLEDLRVRSIPAEHVRFDRDLILQTLARVWWRLPVEVARSLQYPAGEVLGFLCTAQDCSWCFFGSAGYQRELVQDLSPDLALLPVQGRSDIQSVAAEMTALIKPKWVLPHHHDDFYPPLSQSVDLEPFAEEVARRAPETRVYVPQIGRPIVFERGELWPVEEV